MTEDQDRKPITPDEAARGYRDTLVTYRGGRQTRVRIRVITISEIEEFLGIASLGDEREALQFCLCGVGRWVFPARRSRLLSWILWKLLRVDGLTGESYDRLMMENLDVNFTEARDRLESRKDRAKANQVSALRLVNDIAEILREIGQDGAVSESPLRLSRPTPAEFDPTSSGDATSHGSSSSSKSETDETQSASSH